jgi:hypothetical protein
LNRPSLTCWVPKLASCLQILHFSRTRTEFWHPTRNDPRISAALLEALALETPSKVQMGVLPLPDLLELRR